MGKNTKIGNIRAIAIILVVLGHSIIMYTNWGLIHTERSIPYIMYLKRFINILEMPVFMSVGGYVFYYSMKKKKKFTEFAVNKIQRVLIPFILVGTLWVTPLRMFVHVKGWSNTFFGNVINNIILMKSTGHLWYLVSLFLIFIVMYWVLKVGEHFQRQGLFDLLMIFGFLYISMSAKDGYILQSEYAPIQRFFYYLFWFYLGYLLNKYFEEQIGNQDIGIGLLFAVCFAMSFFIYSRYGNTISYYAAAFSGVMSLYLLVPQKTNRFLSLLERDSYGLYLFHSPMVYLTFTWFTNRNPYAVVFINVFGLGLISICMTEILRRTPFAFIIGETYKGRPRKA